MGGGNNKTKSRFDGLDVAAMTAYVKQNLLGHKLANVYDGIAMSASLGDSSGKGTFIFKLANPSANAVTNTNTNTNTNATKATSSDSGSGSGSGSGKDATEDNGKDANTNRSMLLIESGVRFHTTTYYTNSNDSSSTSNNATPPSPFVMKLRKHLRNLRLENITQLGNLDRVVDLRFGSGTYSHHLIIELYGLGNIILTNDQYVILTLLRLHEYESNDVSDVSEGKESAVASTSTSTSTEQVKVRVGNVYPVTYATTMSSKHNHIEDEEEKQEKQSILDMNGEEAYIWAKQQLQLYHDLLS